MKRNRKLSLTLTAALALTALTACGTLPASAATGRETATRIAADHLGCDASELRVTDFERDDGKYELEVIWNGVEYDFEIGIASGKVPVTELNEIFRQSRTSDIVSNAHLINSGTVPDLVRPWQRETDFFFLEVGDMEEAAPILVDLICREIPRRYQYNPFRDIQLLTPMHKGAVGTINMNAMLQQALNPGTGASQTGQDAPVAELRRGETTFRCGDKVMQIKNNYVKDVFNGDVGTIEAIDARKKMVTVSFDERKVLYEATEMDELVLAYAISIHKSQGSEYPAVVIPLFMQHFIMLQRNLVYTAVTRGKKLVVLVGEKRALERAVANADVKRRYTRLTFRLREYVSNLYA